MVVFLTLVLLVVTSYGYQFEDFKEALRSGVAKEVMAAAVPVEEAVSSIASSQCRNVKRLVGVDYDQTDPGDEASLRQLTLDFITPNNTKIVYNLSTAAEDIPKSKEFDPNKGICVYFHGFMDNPSRASFGNISTALLKLNNCSIFALDSSPLLKGFYLRASTYTKYIGNRVGTVLATLAKNGVKGNMVYLIGHSLGAHIAGLVGKKYKKLTGNKLGRISGLDPAGPCFSKIKSNLLLQPTDADFVDVIHTDAGVFGLKKTVGTVDFFPNGGSQQPDSYGIADSHSRAWQLHAESIEYPTNFPAVKCNSWNDFRKGRCEQDVKLMGYGCTSNASGTYFLQTNGVDPFGRGLKGMTFENNEGIIRNVQTALFSGLT